MNFTVDAYVQRLDRLSTSTQFATHVRAMAVTRHPNVAPALAGLLHSDGAIAEAAIDGLLMMDRRHVAPVLRPLLDHDDAETRRNAAYVLVRLGEERAGAVLARDFLAYRYQRLSTVRWLVESGRLGISSILQHADFFTDAAGEAVRHLAERRRSTEPHLLDFAQSRHRHAAHFALSALAQIPSERAAGVFALVFHDAKAPTILRAVSASGLTRLHRRAFVPSFCRVLTNPKESRALRIHCARLLMELGDARALRPLRRVAESATGRLRDAARVSLLHLRAQGSRFALP